MALTMELNAMLASGLVASEAMKPPMVPMMRPLKPPMKNQAMPAASPQPAPRIRATGIRNPGKASRNPPAAPRTLATMAPRREPSIAPIGTPTKPPTTVQMISRRTGT